MNFRLHYFVSVATAVILAGCGMSLSEPPKDFLTPPPTSTLTGVSARATVELDVFSGLPNPTWSLSEAETESFQDKVNALPNAEAGERPNRLGYRGMIVRLGAGNAETLWLIWGGYAQKIQGTRVTDYLDADHHVEDWLFKSGQPYLQPDLFQQIRREIPEAK